mgnify:CR=1 FL=1
MSEGYEKLKLIGIQRIHEDTHIAREHIVAVINGNFQELHKVQFLGFVSILEREYNLELQELKQRGLAYYQEQSSVENSHTGVFVVAKSNKKSTLPYIVIAILIMFVVAFFGIDFSSNKDVVEVQNVENTIILEVKKEIEAIAEINASDLNETGEDLNLSVNPEVVVPKEEPKKEDTFSITPRSKVWMGYIDVETNKKYQKTIASEFTFDTTKEWLVILGHSYVNFFVNKEKINFNTKGNLYLHYKNAKLEKISESEFKKLNKGRKW